MNANENPDLFLQRLLRDVATKHRLARGKLAAVQVRRRPASLRDGPRGGRSRMRRPRQALEAQLRAELLRAFPDDGAALERLRAAAHQQPAASTDTE